MDNLPEIKSILSYLILSYNSSIHGFHTSNYIFHVLAMQLIFELLLTFNRSIKPNTRFLTIKFISTTCSSIPSNGCPIFAIEPDRYFLQISC